MPYGRIRIATLPFRSTQNLTVVVRCAMVQEEWR